MSIRTEKGNAVRFLGLSSKIREELLNALLGNRSDGKITINEPQQCYLGITSGDPEKDGIHEPTDPNYKRIKIGGLKQNGVKKDDKNNVVPNMVWGSDYLTIEGAEATNKGTRNEIKFNRSTEPWSSTFDRFFLTNDGEASPCEILAWGELTEPITVDAKNVVPLFEEGKFRLYFPTPFTVEDLVDEQTEKDAETDVDAESGEEENT